MKIDIVIGLPGSGKSTLVEELLDDTKGLLSEDFLYGGLEKSIKDSLVGYHRTYEALVVDLLFPRMNSVERFITRLNEVIPGEHEFTFHVFNPNLEYALINDFTRGRGIAKNTIKTMYNLWDFELSELPGDVIIHKSYKPTEVDRILYDNEIDSDYISHNAIRSDSWITGSWSREYDDYETNELDEPRIDKYNNPHLKEFLEFLGELNTEELRNEIIDELSEERNDYCTDDYYYGFIINYYFININDLMKYLKGRGLL